MFSGSAGLRPHFFLLEDRMFESAHTKSRPQKREHTLLRAHFCHVSKTACLVALKFKTAFLRAHISKTASLVALISKTASLVALISKTASLVGLILVGAHNEEQNRGYTIDEEVRHP